MAFVFADSFDLYLTQQPANELLLPGGLWNTANIGTALGGPVGTRFNLGKYCSIVKSGITTGVLTSQQWPHGNTSATVYVNFAFFQNAPFATVNDTFMTLLDIATTQVTIHFSAVDQNIYVRTGGTGGTIVATFTNAFTQNVWNHFQIRIVFNNTTGEVRIRKNGVTTDTWVQTGINTRGGSANNYCNGIQFVNGSSTSFSGEIDDLLIFDDSGAAPNTWVGDVRAWILSPAAPGSNTQFTSQPTPTTPISSTVGTFAGVANTVHWSAAQAATYTGTVPSFTVTLQAAMTGHLIACVYADTAGAPGVVLGTSTAVTNPASGVVTFTFPTPVNVVAGVNYHFAIMGDAAFSLAYNNSTGTNWNKTNTGVTYPTFPANPAGGVASAQFTLTINWTPANWQNVNQQVQDGDTTMNYSNIVGATDSYLTNGLPVSPQSIVVAQVRELVRMSDTGARTMQTYFKSGANVTLGAPVILATSYQYMPFQQYATDPNTGAAWTVSGINAIEVGLKVVS
jgi:hypothetical protein